MNNRINIKNFNTTISDLNKILEKHYQYIYNIIYDTHQESDLLNSDMFGSGFGDGNDDDDELTK